MRKIFTNIIFFTALLVLSTNCNPSDNKNKRELKQLAEYKIKVSEPSGLALTIDKKHLWTVSDQNKSAYMLTLDGKIVKSVKIDAVDLEGITIINDTTIAVVSERSGEIIFVGYSGKELNRFSTSHINKNNTGLEGIEYDKNSAHFFIIKEKNPAYLIEYDQKFNELSRKELKFASDYSGVELIAETNQLWIISDENKSLFLCNKKGEVIETYKVKITQIEGIAIDVKSKRIYFVSDIEEKLYIFEYSPN